MHASKIAVQLSCLTGALLLLILIQIGHVYFIHIDYLTLNYSVPCRHHKMSSRYIATSP